MKEGDYINVTGLTYDEVCVLLAGYDFCIVRIDKDVYALITDVL